MRFTYVYLLAMASIIVYTSYLEATTVLATTHGPITAGRARVNNPRTTNAKNSTAATSNRTPAAVYDSALESGSDPTTRGVADVLSCLMKRWYSSDGQRDGCYDEVLSTWNSVPEVQDDETGGIIV